MIWVYSSKHIYNAISDLDGKSQKDIIVILGWYILDNIVYCIDSIMLHGIDILY